MASLLLMKARARFHNRLFAGAIALFLAGPALADAARLDDLFDQLKSADAEQAEKLESDIKLEWSKSGSPAFDLLLERGQRAMAEGDFPTAIEHLTALIDHDPAFAEAYNARATAYYMAGEIGPSIADIRKTLSLNPRHFGAMVGFAMILEELEKPNEAIEVYKAALAIHPHLSGVSEAIARLEAAESGQGI